MKIMRFTGEPLPPSTPDKGWAAAAAGLVTSLLISVVGYMGGVLDADTTILLTTVLTPVMAGFAAYAKRNYRIRMGLEEARRYGSPVRVLVPLAMALSLVACTTTVRDPDEPVGDYYQRATADENAKWAALIALIDQAQKDGINWYDASASQLSYLKLLCSAAIIGPVFIPQSVDLVGFDWNLMPVTVANACQAAFKIATPIETLQSDPNPGTISPAPLTSPIPVVKPVVSG